jgi:nucleotide-binding universal stress UspA family protein
MTVKPIVVGVDGSPESRHAALTGWRLAATTGTSFELLHAVPDVWATAAIAQMPVTADLTGPIVEDARRHIIASLSVALPAEATTGLHIVIGRPEVALADAGARAQLVVVGGKHHGALARGLGGSTAHYLIRTLDVPVLVTAAAGWPIRRVLAAVDLSFATEPTLDAARALARQTGARLRVLHVVEPAHRFFAARVDEAVLYERAAAALHEYSAKMPEVDTRDRVTRRGVAAAAIAAEAADFEADVVVMGSHGRGWVERLLVGSVTEHVLALLPTSLLVVPVRAVPVARPMPPIRAGAGVLL